MLYAHRLLQSNRKYSNIHHCKHMDLKKDEEDVESVQSEGTMQKKAFFNEFVEDMCSNVKMKSRLDENIT